MFGSVPSFSLQRDDDPEIPLHPVFSSLTTTSLCLVATHSGTSFEKESFKVANANRSERTEGDQGLLPSSLWPCYHPRTRRLRTRRPHGEMRTERMRKEEVSDAGGPVRHPVPGRRGTTVQVAWTSLPGELQNAGGK
ncbi:hypothetical protein AGIG_G18898 [Arapaima gigas]